MAANYGDLERAEEEINSFLMDVDAELIPSRISLADKIDLLIEECQSLFFENMIFNIAMEHKLEINDIEYLSELMQDAAEDGGEDFEVSEEGLQSIIEQVRKKKKVDNKH
ncbi:MAG: hypothetical protein A2504_11585 [Bdellovibrionales bacterium RIFOXYD12_FULL_39_22]|nr:MAG: hypothetical protein A2385_16100 [Bdellovibrionales bacterium RIFOXYB1_FULL_39_21]OFZ44520.1 MAG: hypothetical protein A2485_06795 [Bdellovibrionales bacterium RIFOXYC12_FULL_39_17]OFZ49838.1 MAG: hypothetical protein A2404_00670 [Bdellovibrionales bacterium RIFOXYC1_FULL_39_130]OFZ73018.1 MAG: hypothetical protein A2451_16015 [Bdellovibrionales bacterium RIFOXYC2_FULL_39_8]OFZ76843.1 MAG: hypothetical protein A2560_05470 [Bdellovibrionales bacterium RIFOXYD1_FULL_39_84]OFZ95770.1 MAG: